MVSAYLQARRVIAPPVGAWILFAFGGLPLFGGGTAQGVERLALGDELCSLGSSAGPALSRPMDSAGPALSRPRDIL